MYSINVHKSSTFSNVHVRIVCEYTSVLYCLVIILDGHGLHTEFIYSGDEVTWECEEHGIFMHLPKSETKHKITITVKSLHISSNDCVLPDNAELVSAVYQICVSEELPYPVDVGIQHCVRLSSPDEALSMRFVRSNSQQSSSHHFTILDGGQFNSITRYGKIKLSSFSVIAIVFLLRDLLGFPITYAASVFSRFIGSLKYEAHVVVTKNLSDTISVSILLIMADLESHKNLFFIAC